MICRAPQTVMVNCLVVLAPLASVSVTVKVWVVAEEPTVPSNDPRGGVETQALGEVPGRN